MAIRARSSGGIRDFSGATTDISFLLIIFFLVSAVFISDRGIFLRVPQVPPEPRELPIEQVLVLQVHAGDRDFTLEGQRQALDQADELIAARLANWQPEAVLIVADAEASYGSVVRLMEAARKAGAGLFSLQVDGKALALDLMEPLP